MIGCASPHVSAQLCLARHRSAELELAVRYMGSLILPAGNVLRQNVQRGQICDVVNVRIHTHTRVPLLTHADIGSLTACFFTLIKEPSYGLRGL